MDEYHGRLAYDPDTDMHTDNVGRAVVTDDEGKTWRYAAEGDTNHFDKHHQQFAVVDGTANTLMELQLEHGREKAEEIMRAEHPHHYEPSSDDPHYSEGAKDQSGNVTHTRVRSTPDGLSVVSTGHTDAWSQS